MLIAFTLLVIVSLIALVRIKLKKDMKENYVKIKPLIEKFSLDVNRLDLNAKQEGLKHHLVHITLQTLKEEGFIKQENKDSYSVIKPLPEYL